MYNRDAIEIKNTAKYKNSVCGIVGFTLSTIQAGLQTCTGQAEKVIQHGLKADCLWGLKDKGLEYAIKNDAYLYQKTMHIVDQYGYDSIEGITEVILLFMQVPNLGMVKASFVAQMLGFNISCLDSHNLKRLGLSANFTKIPATMTDAGKRKKIKVYIELCQLEGTEYWWNTWCDYVAGNTANRSLPTGDIVSRFHVECVNLWYVACEGLK